MNKELIRYIENNQNKVIAIDGPSGSGKSSLAKELEDNFDVTVFHTDDYFLPNERKTETRLNEPGGNLDYERMLTEIFHHLNDDHIISNKFNCMTNILEKSEPISKKSNIIIEGVYSMHPEFMKFLDLKVFLHIDRKNQLERILSRSGAIMLERFRKEWIPLEDKYFEFFNVKSNADLIINFI